MSNTKFLAGIVTAVFFFAFGVYFHSVLPTDGNREPASAKHFKETLKGSAEETVREPAGAKFDSRATEAFRGCIDSRIKNGSLSVGKVVVEGRRWSIVSIACTGAHAKELYDAIQPYSSEEYVRYRDGRRGVVRFFGRLFPPSQCVQLIGAKSGKEMNEYSCSIRVDVDHEITEQLRF